MSLKSKATVKGSDNGDTLLKPPQSSRDTCRTEHIEVRRDGPAVTRTGPGYVNPLRMNPPTPPGSRAVSPVANELSSSVAEENKSSSTRHSPAGHETDFEMALFNKSITEQLDSAFQIRETDESSLLCPASEACRHRNGEAKIDDGPRGPDYRSEALVQGLGRMEIDSREPDSSAAEHTDHAAAAHSEVLDNSPVHKTDTRAVDVVKTSGETPAKTEVVTGDEDLEKTAKVDNDKAQDTDEAKSAAVDSGTCDGKKPPKIHNSMHLDLGSSSNLHGMNEATTPNNERTEKSTPTDACVTLEEEDDGKKQALRNVLHSTMAKFLKEGSSSLFSKGRKDGEDDSKENSPTFADLTQENPLEYRIELARRYTNTYVELLSPMDTKSPRRANDDRVWYSRNLRCISCEGSCPICETDCCIYRAAKEVLTKPKNFQTEMCSRLVEIIDSLGARVKDMSTFTMCTLDTGCGRRVCPNCCGACPTVICRDVQCKECKPDPWAECDWHA